MPRLPDKSTLPRSFSSVVMELENLLSPSAQTLRVGLEGDSIAIIGIVSSSNMKHTSTAGRGGEDTCVIPIHHIHVGGGDGACSGNVDSADDSIVS